MKAAALWFAIILIPAVAAADDAGFSSLRLPLAARPVSLGEAIAADAADPGSAAYNPGALSLIRRRSASAAYLNYVAGIQAGRFSFVQPCGMRATAAISLSYINSGDIVETSWDQPTTAPACPWGWAEPSMNRSMPVPRPKSSTTKSRSTPPAGWSWISAGSTK